MSHLPRFCPSKADFALDTYRPVRKHPNQRRVIGGEWRKDWVEVSSSGREKGGREKRRLKEGQESILAISLTLIVHHILITSLNVPASEQIYRLSPHSDNPLFRDPHKTRDNTSQGNSDQAHFRHFVRENALHATLQCRICRVFVPQMPISRLIHIANSEKCPNHGGRKEMAGGKGLGKEGGGAEGRQ